MSQTVICIYLQAAVKRMERTNTGTQNKRKPV